MSSFLYDLPTTVLVAILFVLMIVFNWAGSRLKRSREQETGESADGGGAMEGSMLGLLALLLAFTFGMSSSRYDTRRGLVVEEANDIGTVILRTDLYPDSIRNALRSDLQQYLEARIAYFEAGFNEQQVQGSLQQSARISDLLWNKVTALSRTNNYILASQQMVPAMNAMFDAATSRDAARNAHVPESIVWLLFLLTLTASFIIGYGSKRGKTDKIIVAGFALMMVLTIYLILDLDRPRRGIITMDKAHGNMTGLRELFK